MFDLKFLHNFLFRLSCYYFHLKMTIQIRQEPDFRNDVPSFGLMNFYCIFFDDEKVDFVEFF